MKFRCLKSGLLISTPDRRGRMEEKVNKAVPSKPRLEPRGGAIVVQWCNQRPIIDMCLRTILYIFTKIRDSKEGQWLNQRTCALLYEQALHRGYKQDVLARFHHILLSLSLSLVYLLFFLFEGGVRLQEKIKENSIDSQCGCIGRDSSS